MEYVLARILLKLNILSNGVLSRAAVGEVTKDGVLSREWENGVEGGYASRTDEALLVRGFFHGSRRGRLVSHFPGAEALK